MHGRLYLAWRIVAGHKVEVGVPVMSYDHCHIADAVHKCLLENPRATLNAVAVSLGIERHTIRRALVRNLGVTFRDVQRQCILRRASEFHQEGRPYSSKEMSFALGYRSAATLSRLIRRVRARN